MAKKANLKYRQPEEIEVRWYPTRKQKENMVKLFASNGKPKPFCLEEVDLGIKHLKGWFYLQSAHCGPWDAFTEDRTTAIFIPTDPDR